MYYGKSTALALLVFHPAVAQDYQAPPGFTALFDGKSLSGWTIPAGDNGHWRVVDGVIDYDAASEAHGERSLFTEIEYGDYDLSVDWRLKEAPCLNQGMRYILPDGSYAKDL